MEEPPAMLYNFCKSRHEELIFAHLNVGALFGDNLSKPGKIGKHAFPDIFITVSPFETKCKPAWFLKGAE